jgi:hypothetical protein
MADDDDGGAGALSGGFEGAEGMTDVLITGGRAKEGDEGVDDDQGGIEALHDGLEDG